MYSFNQIGELASGILKYEFDFIEDHAEQQAELLNISGSLVSKIGELNILLNQNFCCTGDINLGCEEKTILEEIYLRDYNTKQARKILRGSYNSTISGIDASSAGWTELREGDTTIKRPASAIPGLFTNKLDLSKNFKALAAESEQKIKDLAYTYNMYGAVPRQVAGKDAPDIDYLLCHPATYTPSSGYSPTGTGVSPTGIDPSGIDPSGINPSGINPSGINPSGINPSGINPSGINPSGIDPSGIDPSGIDPSGIDPSGINPSGIDPSGFTGIDLVNDYRVAFNIDFIEDKGEVIYPYPPFIPGEEIQVSPKPDYGFEYWSGIEPNNLSITSEGIFIMPERDVIISGKYN
jgi:hypothetical protein